jgi:predicted nucleic acid-binding Zn ribbon protein
MTNPTSNHEACAVCGRPFASSRSDARHCGRRCRQAAWRRQRSASVQQSRRRRCPRCGSIFVAARTDGVYCSNACRQAVHRRRACLAEVAR